MALLPALLLLALGVPSPAAPPAAPPGNGEAQTPAASPGSGEAPAELPRTVENPGASGARFGLGIDLLSDRLDGVEETASRTVVTLVRPDGSEERLVRPGDPELTNRKFDLELELRGVGVQVPAALPSFHLGPVVAVHPAVVLELALVEAELRYVGRTEADAGSVLAGEGPMLGLGIDWVASACRRCRLFWGGGYRYRLLPELDLDRSPDAGGPALQVLRDEIRLSAGSHRVTGRLGYAMRGGRSAPYVGFRYHATDVEVEDELRLRAPELGEETGLRTRADLEADGLAGVLGLDVAIGRRYAARVEAAIGDDSASGLVKLVGFAGGEPGRPRRPDPVEALLANGPRVVLTRRSVEVDGVLRGGWPVVVEAELPVDGVLRMRIETPGHPPVEHEFPGRAGETISEVRFLPASLGQVLLAGRLSLRAVAGGERGEVPFRFLGLGAGSGSVASLALEWIDFSQRGPRDLACEFKFKSKAIDQGAFDRARADIFRLPAIGEDGRARSVDHREVEGREPCLTSPDEACSMTLTAPAPGFYGLQVTAWRGDVRDPGRADWLAGVHPEEREIEP